MGARKIFSPASYNFYILLISRAVDIDSKTVQTRKGTAVIASFVGYYKEQQGRAMKHDRRNAGSNDRLFVSPTASRMTRAQYLSMLRDQLPVHEYLNVLHTIAMTGRVPVYEPDQASQFPTFTGSYTEPDRKLQHQTLLYLTEKAFSAMPREAPTVNVFTATPKLLEESTAKRLSLTDLLQILQNTAVTAESDADRSDQ